MSLGSSRNLNCETNGLLTWECLYFAVTRGTPDVPVSSRAATGNRVSSEKGWKIKLAPLLSLGLASSIQTFLQWRKAVCLEGKSIWKIISNQANWNSIKTDSRDLPSSIKRSYGCFAFSQLLKKSWKLSGATDWSVGVMPTHRLKRLRLHSQLV